MGSTVWQGRRIADDDPDPLVTRHRAAVLLGALSHPDRLRLLTGVNRREQVGDDCSLSGLAEATGLDLRVLIRQAVALAEAGVMTIQDKRLASRLPVLAETADRLAADLPMSRLLENEPDLQRFLSYGRLPTLPVTGRSDERRRLGRADRPAHSDRANAGRG